MKLLLSLAICLLFSMTLLSQDQDTIPEQKPEKEKKSIKQKVFLGGTVGLSFGSFSRIAIYPQIGLRVNDKFRTALQIGYEYISDTRGSVDYSGSNYGASIWAQYQLFKALYIHVEPAYYNYDGIWNPEGSDRFWVPYVFAGAGLHKRLGGRSVLYAQVKVDLIQDSKSPYNDWAPFFDIGISVGL